ncbi:MAG: hypothetical protein HRJ53_13245 [Acidobacteria bacterium Pan2503]|uniref:Uncharacterized protein n=1 Tax=Candidatus Acidiferrum panamense TaxID=2741543 RepID=A0A7V8NR55_9BACT|nr:hypothetical protein [Candidatus Acidoferrum panamensis]
MLATLALGLPILVVLAIRFLWDRNLYLGRSKELEKLIWQLHRIASAMEHQMNLSFPAVQPGTEEPSDLGYLQQPAAQAPKAARQAAAQSVAAPSGTAPVSEDKEPAEQQPATSEPSAEPPRHAGVNSMFGL